VLVLALCLVRLGTGAGTDRGFADWGILVDRSYKRATDEGGNSIREPGSMLPGKLKNIFELEHERNKVKIVVFA